MGRRALRGQWRWLWLVPALLLSACGDEPVHPEYVARVGTSYLTEGELQSMLVALPIGLDSVQARQQVVEQWVTNELLFQEAIRRGLRDEPDVRRLLRENERSVLVSALVGILFEEAEGPPTAAEVQAYFERHREQLRLREPYLRVRHLAAADETEAREVRQRLQEISGRPEADSVWLMLIDRFAADRDRARLISGNYFPESQLFSGTAELRAHLGQLRPAEIAPLTTIRNQVHVLQLVDRVPEGSLPEIAWIREEILQRLGIEKRKQIYARQVQRFRNEALAEEELDIR